MIIIKKVKQWPFKYVLHNRTEKDAKIIHSLRMIFYSYLSFLNGSTEMLIYKSEIVIHYKAPSFV